MDNCQLGDGTRIGIEELRVESNVGATLATILTLGMWRPLKVGRRCAKPPGIRDTLDLGGAMILRRGQREWQNVHVTVKTRLSDLIDIDNTAPAGQAQPRGANGRFIESYLAGLNHAFAGELRWREYPTDQRGTCFRQFWDTSQFAITPEEQEQYRDIGRMHEWTGALGQNRPKRTAAPAAGAGPAQQGNPAMVLIRGDLFRRYPDTIVYAVPARRVRFSRRFPAVVDCRTRRTTVCAWK